MEEAVMAAGSNVRLAIAVYRVVTPIVSFAPSWLWCGLEGWLLAVMRRGALGFDEPAEVLPFETVVCPSGNGEVKLPAVSRPVLVCYRRMMPQPHGSCSVFVKRGGVTNPVVSDLLLEKVCDDDETPGWFKKVVVTSGMGASGKSKGVSNIASGKAKTRMSHGALMFLSHICLVCAVRNDKISEAFSLFLDGARYGIGAKTASGWGKLKLEGMFLMSESDTKLSGLELGRVYAVKAEWFTCRIRDVLTRVIGSNARRIEVSCIKKGNAPLLLRPVPVESCRISNVAPDAVMVLPLRPPYNRWETRREPCGVDIFAVKIS